MDVQVAEAGPCRRTLTITLTPDHLRTHVDRMYKDASKEVKLPGFRPGHVPRKVMEKKFGDAILAQAKEEIVNHSLRDAIRQNELEVVGQPKVEGIEEGPLDPAQPMEFTVEVDIRPTFELGDVKGIPAEKPATEVTDEDIDHALQQVADSRKSLRTVEEPIQEQDFFKADMVFTGADGAELQTREGQQLNTDIPVNGVDPAAFKEAVMGKTAGDSIEAAITFPDTFEKEEARGTEGKVKISVKEVLRVSAPEIDDELAKGFEFESLDALKAEMRTRIASEKQRISEQQVEEKILETLADRTDFPLPQSMVEDQLQQNLAQFRQQLEQNREQHGMTDEQIEEKITGAQDEARQDAEKRVRMFFLIDGVARQEGLQLAEDDLRAEVSRVAQGNQVPEEAVYKWLEEDRSRVQNVQLMALERKVRVFLRENASISDQ